jgi:hypothetical protein
MEMEFQIHVPYGSCFLCDKFAYFKVNPCIHPAHRPAQGQAQIQSTGLAELAHGISHKRKASSAISHISSLSGQKRKLTKTVQ